MRTYCSPRSGERYGSGGDHGVVASQSFFINVFDRNRRFSAKPLGGITRRSGKRWPRRASPCRRMYKRNLQITSDAGGWNTGPCGCNAPAATMGTWSRTVAGDADSASAVVVLSIAESVAPLVDEVLPEPSTPHGC